MPRFLSHLLFILSLVWGGWLSPLAEATSTPLSASPATGGSTANVAPPPYECTALPNVVQLYLKQLRTQGSSNTATVRVRPDCLVIVDPGYTYIPVLPQQLPVQPPDAVVRTWPANALAERRPADIIEFNHNYYLLRLLPTQSGKLTFPRLDTYPAGLKTGLLPQNWVVPTQLSIPAELKILLGDLPFSINNPTNPADSPQATALQPLTDTLNTLSKEAETLVPPLPRGVYVAGLDTLSLMLVEPYKKRVEWQLPLPGVATVVLPFETQGKLLLNVLHKPEALVVDGNASLIQRHINLPAPLFQAMLQQNEQKAVLQYKHQPFFTVLDTTRWEPTQQPRFSSDVTSLSVRQRVPLAYVTTREGNTLHEVDLLRGITLRRLQPKANPAKGIKKATVLNTATASILQETATGFGTLWVWHAYVPATYNLKGVATVPAHALLQGIQLATGILTTQERYPVGSQWLGLDASQEWQRILPPATADTPEPLLELVHGNTGYTTHVDVPANVYEFFQRSMPTLQVPYSYTHRWSPSLGWIVSDPNAGGLRRLGTEAPLTALPDTTQSTLIPLNSRIASLALVGLGKETAFPALSLSIPESYLAPQAETNLPPRWRTFSPKLSNLPTLPKPKLPLLTLPKSSRKSKTPPSV